MNVSNRFIFCANCGCRIDTTQAQVFYDFDTKNPFCRNCSQNKNISRTNAVSKVGRVILSILRLYFAAHLFLFAFVMLIAGGSFGFFVMGLFLFLGGVGLIIWQLWPLLKPLAHRQIAKKSAKKAAEEQEKQADRENARVKSCPHCGGYGTGNACPYCGMPFR